MAAVIYLDTHVVVWLYAGDLERFPAKVREVLEAEDLAISPIVLLEMQYLRETELISDDAHVIRTRLGSSLGLAVRDVALHRVVEEALLYRWTRDTFDRLIVAQAAMENERLLTKDRAIRKNYPAAFWSR